MMQLAYLIYIYAILILILLVVARAVWCGLLARHRAQWIEPMRMKYLHIVMSAFVTGKEEPPHFPLLHRYGARQVLAEVVSRLSLSTAGLDPDSLRHFVKTYRLDELFLRRARRTRGEERAFCLLQLAGLPLDVSVAKRVASYRESSNRSVRFYALLVQLACHPTAALSLMATFREPFTPFERSELIALLRRGALPITYDALLAAPEHHLKCFGLAIVREFGIEEAQTRILRLVANPPTAEVGIEAMYTLCALRGSSMGRAMKLGFSRMTAEDRKTLLRHMVNEGYATHLLERWLDREERPYFETLVHSYKRTIVCS
ncbi:MAG: hypothetical protein RRY73_06655 [Alistipes sp.]